MRGRFTARCSCGASVGVTPKAVIGAGPENAAAYESAATVATECNMCNAVVSATLPLVIEAGQQTDLILGLSSREPLPGEVVIALIDDLLSTVATRPALVRIFPDIEHYLFTKTAPQCIAPQSVHNVVSDNRNEEVMILQDVMNNLVQAGEVEYAILLAARIASVLPEIMADEELASNVQLLSLLAAERGGDVSEPLSVLQHAQAEVRLPDTFNRATWMVPIGFDKDGPTLRGVPPGYVTPTAYIESAPVAPGDKLLVYLFLLLGSGKLKMALNNDLPDPADLLHQIAHHKLQVAWSQAPLDRRDDARAIYASLSGGSLEADADLVP